MCMNTMEYIRDENSLNYHLTTVTSYESLNSMTKPEKPYFRGRGPAVVGIVLYILYKILNYSFGPGMLYPA